MNMIAEIFGTKNKSHEDFVRALYCCAIYSGMEYSQCPSSSQDARKLLKESMEKAEFAVRKFAENPKTLEVAISLDNEDPPDRLWAVLSRWGHASPPLLEEKRSEWIDEITMLWQGYHGRHEESDEIFIDFFYRVHATALLGAYAHLFHCDTDEDADRAMEKSYKAIDYAATKFEENESLFAVSVAIEGGLDDSAKKYVLLCRTGHASPPMQKDEAEEWYKAAMAVANYEIRNYTPLSPDKTTIQITDEKGTKNIEKSPIPETPISGKERGRLRKLFEKGVKKSLKDVGVHASYARSVNASIEYANLFDILEYTAFVITNVDLYDDSGNLHKMWLCFSHDGEVSPAMPSQEKAAEWGMEHFSNDAPDDTC